MTQITNITDRAMLVYINISVWSARKLDKKATQRTIADASATADSARVNKNLLANADAKLRELQRKANQIRDYISANTLPWDDAGNRLVSNAQALVMVGELHRHEMEFKALVDEFVAEYPVMRAAALHNLGDMANAEDYPQPDVVRSKFRVKVSFSPLAADYGDMRVGMSEDQARAWQQAFEADVKRQTNDALRAAYSRLQEILERYSDRLSPRPDDPTKVEKFRDTMVEQLRDTLGVLGSLNVFGDAELDKLLGHLKATVAVYEPDALRTSIATSLSVKSEVDEALRRMQQMLG